MTLEASRRRPLRRGRPVDRADLRARGSHRIPRHELPAGEHACRRRVPDRPRRADARRQRADEPRDVRDHVDGAAGREADGRVLRQEHDRQGRVPADGGARDALRQHPQPALARARRDEATGCSTTGSSEAAMLGGLALKRRWQQRRAAEGKPTDKPNLVMGINVQVCWEKFANYWDVEMRLVPMEGDRFHLSAEEAVKLCDENTIGVVAILGSTFDGSYEPVEEICAALDDLQERDGARRPGPRRRRVGRVRRARSSTRTWSGTSGCRASPRSTRRATSTGSSTRASAGSSGATPRRCPRT